MRAKLAVALALLGVIATQPVLAQSVERQVSFAKGKSSADVRGSIKGYADVTYRLRVGDGQVMQVLFAPSNRSCYFNAYRPGATEAVHNGSMSGNEFGQSPTVKGEYKFQVYLMRNAARRDETCRYSLSFEVTGGTRAAASPTDEQMRASCQARVVEMYAVRASVIRMAALATAKDGPRIDGTVNKGAEGIKKFRCLYTPGRQLRDVMAMTPDGE
jgi:hypothetical protein